MAIIEAASRPASSIADFARYIDALGIRRSEESARMVRERRPGLGR